MISQKKVPKSSENMYSDYIDIQKVYNSVPNRAIQKALYNKDFFEDYVNLIRKMYDVEMKVNNRIENSNNFKVRVRGYQRLALSFLLYNTLLDNLLQNKMSKNPNRYYWETSVKKMLIKEYLNRRN